MEEKKANAMNMDMEKCTQDCGTCPSPCNIDITESGPSFFERLESISERFDEVGEEDIIDMLNEAVAELEAEEAVEEEIEIEVDLKEEEKE